MLNAVAALLRDKRLEVCLWGFLPVNASVVVVPVEELDLLKGLLAGVVTGQVRVHAKKQVERSRPWEGKERSGGDKTKKIKGKKRARGLKYPIISTVTNTQQ